VSASSGIQVSTRGGTVSPAGSSRTVNERMVSSGRPAASVISTAVVAGPVCRAVARSSPGDLSGAA
jgi:hypothetical protein